MNVLLINGSPHKNGCTNAALTEMAKVLNEAGIQATIFHLSSAPVGGCVDCGGCRKPFPTLTEEQKAYIERVVKENM